MYLALFTSLALLFLQRTRPRRVRRPLLHQRAVLHGLNLALQLGIDQRGDVDGPLLLLLLAARLQHVGLVRNRQCESCGKITRE
jgi:hypothetical protein